MTDPAPRLAALGDALERAAAADLAAGSRRSPWRRPRRRRLVAAVVVLAVAVPGAALAARQLIGNDEVARSLPNGTLALAGTHPTCTTVEDGVEYRCTLERAPAPEVSNWLGTVEPSVDDSKHVNGGCRSLAADGRTWECYLGQAAVEQQIIGPGLLGAYAPTPGVG
jgi:hypothetical protein